MQLSLLKSTVLLFVFLCFYCRSKTKTKNTFHQTATASTHTQPPLLIGAAQTEVYLPLLKKKRIGIVANQTSVIPKKNKLHYTHLIDSLLSEGIAIKKIFALEHGFRGKADAGKAIKDGIDTKTMLPITSLYGKNKKPSAEHLSGIDIMVFDIQNVGARFYTYISSLHYIMEACAEQRIPLIVLDRPNPNRHIIDGPVLESKFKSFVGMHPVPIIHGMTIGEYARMINGENWLKTPEKCDLKVIPVKNYDGKTPYHLPIKPSPNLPNDRSINLYPSLCLFEGTTVSVGRGTTNQFQQYGSPFLSKTSFSFTPKPNEGAKHPKHKNKLCYGYNLKHAIPEIDLNLSYLVNAYKTTTNKASFFNSNNFFNKLAGNATLKQQIIEGMPIKDIKATWKSGLDHYKLMRKNYTLYD